MSAEVALLAAAFAQPERCLSLGIEPADFAHAGYGKVYAAIRSLLADGKPVDAITVTQRLGDDAQARQFVGEAMMAQGSAANIESYADAVKRAAKCRGLVEVAAEISNAARQKGADPDTIASGLITKLVDMARTTQGHEYDMKALMALVVDDLAQAYERKELGGTVGVPYGIGRLDSLLGGMHRSHLILVGARPKMGKAQPLDANVLTLGGWKLMGELELGDKLASVDGADSEVIGVYPQGEKQIYRVTFSDGRSTEACAEHLWAVHNRKWLEPRIMQTTELMELLEQPQHRCRLWIETVSGDFGSSSSLPIAPWALGALLANGTLSGATPRFSSGDGQNVHRLAAELSGIAELRYASQYDYRLVSDGVGNELKRRLEDLEIYGCAAHEKRIPRCYMEADKSFRIELLRGLIDNDGWVEKKGSVLYSSSSAELIKDVVELVRSLGGLCRVSSKAPAYTYKGERREGRAHYTCVIRHADTSQFVSLHRKRKRTLELTSRAPRLTFESIVPTRVAEAQCIAVSHSRHLYVTDDYIVTHNTAFLASVAMSAARRGYRIGIVSAEMSGKEMGKRLASAVACVPVTAINGATLTQEQMDNLTAATTEITKLPIRLMDQPGCRVGDVQRQARAWAMRGDLDLLLIDYLGRISPDQKNDRKDLEVGDMAAAYKTLALTLDVPVMLLAQLSRDLEKRPDKRPMASDFRDSGVIEQEADQILMLYRDCVYHDGAPEDEAEILIEANRHGPVGVVPVKFDGPRMVWMDRDMADYEGRYE